MLVEVKVSSGGGGGEGSSCAWMRLVVLRPIRTQTLKRTLATWRASHLRSDVVLSRNIGPHSRHHQRRLVLPVQYRSVQ